jgi:hypothetical protein
VIWLSGRRRLPVTIALIFGLVAIGAILSVSHGSKPSADGVYTGTVIVQTKSGTTRGERPVSFDVAASAGAVQAFRFTGGVPSLCRATAGTTVSGRATIVGPGRFLARLPINRAATRVGTLLISGAFHTLGRESGALRTTFGPRDLRNCEATGGYTTRSGGL